MNRRQFIQISAGAAAAAMAPWRRAYAAWPAQSPGLMKFVQPLPRFGVDIPVASKVTYPGMPAGLDPGFDYYEVTMRQFSQVLHPGLTNATRLWGYADATAGSPNSHLGGAIIASRNRPVRIKFSNELPNQHLMPVDATSPGVGAGTMAHHNRAVVHLHGGHVPWPSDGGPFHWFTPGFALKGASLVDWLPNAAGVPTNDYWYPNDQSARLMWYHDHAMGITRINAYAGLATGYILTDDITFNGESRLIGAGVLPPFLGPRDIPLVFQDKIFATAATVNEWALSPGDLWYPKFYEQTFFGPPAPAPNGLPIPSLNPEFWGDTILANGVVSPSVTVQPTVYRFRILNACNTRFLAMRLVRAVGKVFPDNTEGNPGDPGPAMRLIGNEAGFLDPTFNPQGVLYPNSKTSPPLLIAPAERADVLIDFSRVKSGTTLILYNDAPVPFPGGTPLADFYPQNSKLPVPPVRGFTPDTRALLQIKVEGAPGAGLPAGWSLPPLDPQPIVPAGVFAPPPGATVRVLTLNEAIDQYGRLSQLFGTTDPRAVNDAQTLSPLFGVPYDSPATETPNAGSIEFWQIFNVSADAHPIHFHLANVQVVSRQPFNVRQFNGVPNFTAGPRGPDPDEMGWKETVRMLPGECTTVAMKFDLPPNPVVPVVNAGIVTSTPVTVPESPRTGGHEYVWHCHILEHEEHDMMRPLIVTP